MTQTQKIYVQLLDEGSDAARPTQAEKLDDGTFRILPTADYETADEVWEFVPGSIVKCETREWNGKEYLLAVKQVTSHE